MFFDTHVHYNDERYDDDRDSLISALPGLGVTRVLCPSDSMQSSHEVIGLSGKYDYVWAAVGVHPHNARDVRPEDIDTLRRMVKSYPRVRAVGEIGLDYHYDNSPRDIQREVFESQMDLARELDVPVIIHCREADEDCLNVVRAYSDVRCVYHCYSGSLETAKILVGLGCYISFTGTVTYKNARRTVETAAWLPDDRIMIETDAPYLPPEPHRGKRNDSSLVPLVCQKLADIRGVTLERMAEITTANACAFFGIK